MQTKRQSAIETAVNITVGMTLAFLVNLMILPWIKALSIESASGILTFVFTVLSIIRQYTLRRIFNHLHHKK